MKPKAESGAFNQDIVKSTMECEPKVNVQTTKKAEIQKEQQLKPAPASG
ncbi:hypothetical protein V1498_20065 [Peribacillus sp. SCS-26]